MNGPPRKPGGLEMFYVLLSFIWLSVEGVECHSTDEGELYKSSDETQVLLVIVAVLLFILTLRGKDDREMELRKMREMRQRRIAKKKQAKLQRRMKRRSSLVSSSSKYGGPSSSSVVSNNVKEFKDSKSQSPEREILLDRLMENTLDQDIERHAFSDGRSMNHNVFDRERERTQNAVSADFDECPNGFENDVSSSTRRMEQNSFRDLFNIQLESFSAISSAFKSQYNVEYNTLLWNKFGLEIMRLGKNFAALET